MESDGTSGNSKYNPLLFLESDVISTTLGIKKVANGDRMGGSQTVIVNGEKPDYLSHFAPNIGQKLLLFWVKLIF